MLLRQPVGLRARDVEASRPVAAPCDDESCGTVAAPLLLPLVADRLVDHGVCHSTATPSLVVTERLHSDPSAKYTSNSMNSSSADRLLGVTATFSIVRPTIAARRCSTPVTPAASPGLRVGSSPTTCRRPAATRRRAPRRAQPRARPARSRRCGGGSGA